MTENSLRKYLRREESPLRGTKIRTPVVLSDSKALCLQEVVSSDTSKHIIWWAQRGAKVSDRVVWLKQNIKDKIKELGSIHLYVWLATCDLTSKDKSGFISVTAHDNSTVEYILEKYSEIVKILSRFADSRVTFLVTPAYCIPLWNKHLKHKNPGTFNDQDSDLHHQIDHLNYQIKDLNTSVNTISPDFNIDLIHNPRRKTCRYRKTVTKHQYNFDLYKDGIHPKNVLAKVWLKKLCVQIKRDCWRQD